MGCAGSTQSQAEGERSHYHLLESLLVYRFVRWIGQEKESSFYVSLEKIKDADFLFLDVIFSLPSIR